MITLFASHKGGVGKTTLATNIATWLVQKGHDTILIDADRQGSATAWCASREDKTDRKYITNAMLFGNLRNPLLDLEGRYKEILVDVGGQDSMMLRSAMTVADVVVIPLQPSQFDLWATAGLLEDVRAAKAVNEKMRVFGVINRAPTNVKINETEEAQSWLKELQDFSVARTVVHDRKIYRDAAFNGFGVVEMHNEAAIHEVKTFGAEIYEQVSATS